jgi:hypothetical protein
MKRAYPNIHINVKGIVIIYLGELDWEMGIMAHSNCLNLWKVVGLEPKMDINILGMSIIESLANHLEERKKRVQLDNSWLSRKIKIDYQLSKYMIK